MEVRGIFRICGRCVLAVLVLCDYVLPAGKLLISLCKLDVVFCRMAPQAYCEVLIELDARRDTRGFWEVKSLKKQSNYRRVLRVRKKKNPPRVVKKATKQTECAHGDR